MKTTREMSKALFGGGLVFLLVLMLANHAVAHSCLLPPAGLVSWWPGDGNANDIIGANHGTLGNGATFAPGLVAQAFSFDGVDDFVQVPDSNLWAFGTNDFTIEMWVNFESVEPSTIGHPQVVFIGNDEGSGEQNKWTFAFGGGVLYWHINSPTLGPIFMVLAPFSPVVHQWYHLAVTRSGSMYTIYVDGTPVGSETNTDEVPDANAPLTIGQSESPPEDFFMHGRIDEVAIYNRALSAAEIQAIFNAGSAGKCKIVNEFIAFEPIPSTYRFTTDITGCPVGFTGIFSFNARLTNISDGNLTNLQVEVAELTDGNLLLTEESLLGEGERFSVPQRDGFIDARLSPGELVDVPFAVCLQERRQFRLFVDVLGTVLLPVLVEISEKSGLDSH